MLETRIRNQKLAASTLRKPADVVAWLGAVQAQDYHAAKWGVARRAMGLTDEAVDDAFDEGQILRTHVLRPTWHFVTPSDIRWMLMLTGPRVQALNQGPARTLGLTARDFTRGRAVVERALDGGQFLTRPELAQVLGRAGIVADGQRLAYLMMHFELVGAVCSGPRRGRQFTYALLATRVPEAGTLAREEAIAALTTRYFRSHGPATVRDFSWWSGFTMREARAGTEMTKVDVLADAPTSGIAPGATFLLPNYDEYLIAYRDRGAVIDRARSRNLGVFTNLEYPHHLIVDGRVAGSWKRTVATSSASIHVKTYGKLSRTEVAHVTREAQRYGAFLQLKCEVSW